MLKQRCPWQLPKRSTRPISGRSAGFGAGSGRDGACAVRTASRGGRWLVNDGGRVCSFSSACRSPLIDPCERTSPARPSSAIATAMLSLWASSPMNSNGFVAVGSVWFFIEATGSLPAFAALQPLACNPRLRPTETAVFFPLCGWSSWAALETLGHDVFSQPYRSPLAPSFPFPFFPMVPLPFFSMRVLASHSHHV